MEVTICIEDKREREREREQRREKRNMIVVRERPKFGQDKEYQ